MSKKNKSIKPIRYIVNFNDDDQDNFSSYNCDLDKLNKSIHFSAYSFAIHAACSRKGTIYADFETDDPTDRHRFRKIKDYNK